ncbi:MAG: type II toxin-antitoxin system PemK/MazF family toxin [Spirochaetales bacterium]
MTRGNLVTVVVPGEYGKPRPALVVQSNYFAGHPSVSILPITSELRDTPLFRIAVVPGPANGLLLPSQIMIDKLQTVSADKVGLVIGKLDDTTMVSVTRAVALWLGFAG